MGIFNQSGAATTANQNVAQNPLQAILANLQLGGLAVSEETANIDKKERHKCFSMDVLFALNADKPKTALTALYLLSKPDTHDKKGRDWQIVISGANWSTYCAVSAEIASAIESNADLKAKARPVGTKLDKCPNAIADFIVAVGINRIDDVVSARYCIELTDENPAYPEKSDENGEPSGEFVYFNNRLAFRQEVGELMSDEEKQNHPAFKAWSAAQSKSSSDSNDAA